jgi:hypothetical protein
MSSTKQIVRAEYKVASYFKIPKGLDLEDETIVRDWFVKWDELRIFYVDGREEIINRIECEEDDRKYPEEEPTIEDAEEYSLEDYFTAEEDEDEDKE